ATRQPGAPVPFEVKNISLQTSIVTVLNQAEGIPALRISVNKGNRPVSMVIAGLHNGESRSVSIASLLPGDGSPVTVTITALGGPSGRALVIFAPKPITPVH